MTTERSFTSDRRDLFVEFIFMVGHPERFPRLSRFDVQRQDPVGVLGQHAIESLARRLSLGCVAAVPD